MANLMQSLRDWFAPVQTLTPGMYHYISPADDPRNYRLHLRIEADGSGVLVVNASTILHLNQTAAEYAYCIIKNMTPKDAANRISARFTVTKEQAQLDYLNLVDRLQILINTPDLDPETFLDFDRRPAHASNPTAPYRLDCALTYRLPADAEPQAAPVDRVKQELTTEQWLAIFDKALEIGIPHIIFTGGEPTLRRDLPELIAHLEKNGQVAGLISDGKLLGDPQSLQKILQNGLDHLMIVLQPGDEQIWDTIQKIVLEDIFLAVHLTVSVENLEQIPELLSRLAAIGVRAVSLSTSDPALKDQLESVRNQVAQKQMQLVWNLPVPYSALHPIALETTQWSQYPGAGRDWLYLEPDGDVLPSQGENKVLGNFLTDAWEKIWHN
jgi:hypothetical protein